MKRFSRYTVVFICAAFLGCERGGVPDGGGGGGGGGGGSQGLPDLELANVATENTTARKSTISEDGGTLSVTDSNGVVYTLTLPESALREETEISMYPVNGVSTLPAGAQVAGGVHFEPDGLELQLAATLTMEFPAGTDLASLYAVTYKADGADPALNISLKDERTLTMQIQHFSGGIAVSGEDALGALGSDASGTAAAYIDRIARASQGFAADDPALTAAVLPIYVEWYEDHVRPLVNASGVTAFVSQGRAEYEAWRSVAAMTGILPQLQPQVDDSIPVLAAFLNRWYTFFNDACTSDPGGPLNSQGHTSPVENAAIALEAGALARQWGVPLQSNNLHDEFLLDNLCVKVVIDTLLPDGLDRAGDNGILTVGAHFTIAGGTARTDLPIRIQLTRGSSAFGNPSSGRQDSAGFFESQITWPEGVDPLTIDVLAKLDRSGLRKIARFDRVTIGCTPPEVISIRPESGGRFQTGIFRPEISGEPTSYEWDFGGGATPNTSTESDPFVTFGEVGNFTGSLTLTNDCSSSTVHFFEYEVIALGMNASEYVGTLTEQVPSLGIDCEGPGRARFAYVTTSGPPEFQIQYEFFDCFQREGGVTGTTLLFPFNEVTITESSFETSDGFGSGSFDGTTLTFAYSSSSRTVTFEGVVVVP